MRVRAVLFDLDDTLLDYGGPVEACWAAACGQAAAPAGLDPEALTATIHDVRRWFWGDPDRHARERTDMLGAWGKIAALALERLGRPSAPLAAAIARDFARRRERSSALFADARPCLDALRARGVPLGLVTNGDAGMQRAKLRRHGLRDDFAVVVVEGELGIGKPHPRVYHHALDALGIGPEGTIMVGDNLEWDVAGAQAVGLGGVWIDRRGGGLPAGTPVRPTRVIDTLAPLADLVAG